MQTQTVVAAALVVACAGFVLWQLLPRSLRQRAARACGRPTTATRDARCGGCQGCSAARPAGAPSPPQPLAQREHPVRVWRQPSGR